MDKLEKGYVRFQTIVKENPDWYNRLSHGQSPYYMVIGCSDSRVMSSKIFQVDEGEIFGYKNVANVVPVFKSDDSLCYELAAATLFAVKGLKVRALIVMGHSNCGGVQRLLEENKEENLIDSWMETAQGAKEKAKQAVAQLGGSLQQLCEEENVKLSLKNLKTYPWVQEAVQAGELELRGLHFDIKNAQIREYNENKDQFIPW